MTVTIHSAVPLLFVAAGLCGIIPRAGVACWPLVLAAGLVWVIVG